MRLQNSLCNSCNAVFRSIRENRIYNPPHNATQQKSGTWQRKPGTPKLCPRRTKSNRTSRQGTRFSGSLTQKRRCEVEVDFAAAQRRLSVPGMRLSRVRLSRISKVEMRSVFRVFSAMFRISVASRYGPPHTKWVLISGCREVVGM